LGRVRGEGPRRALEVQQHEAGQGRGTPLRAPAARTAPAPALGSPPEPSALEDSVARVKASSWKREVRSRATLGVQDRVGVGE